MKNVVTKIGEVEITPQIASVLEKWFQADLEETEIDKHIQWMNHIQDFLCRVIVDESPDPEVAKSCLAKLLIIKDILCELI